MMADIELKARLLAFYLPQYHPIPENDRWWGKGFTEWTNVAKAKPLFSGHHQPHIPAELGFYDLRLPEVRAAQAELARQNGITGFCYWHYYFGNGRRLLQRPFQEVLSSGEPDFPFCLAWANQSWTGIWHGAPDRVLIEQQYPGHDDFVRHFYELLPAFMDERYLKVNDKPIFLVYAPMDLPDPKRFIDCWQELAVKAGMTGLHMVGIADAGWSPAEHGFDAATFHPHLVRRRQQSRLQNYIQRLLPRPQVVDYKRFVDSSVFDSSMDFHYYPCVVPNWDNTSRCGCNGVVFRNASPDLFKKHLANAIDAVSQRDAQRRIVFVKSWNEWAEGNYLEPDMEYGHAYLEVIRSLSGMKEQNK